LAAALVLAAASATQATATEAVDVLIDFAKVMKLERPAASVIIGNSGIVDATISDPKLIVLTGKAAGTTNLIILDAEGEPITDAVVTVSSSRRQLTTVFRRAQRATYSCAPVCEQVVAVGDSNEYFEQTKTQATTRGEFSGTR